MVRLSLLLGCLFVASCVVGESLEDLEQETGDGNLGDDNTGGDDVTGGDEEDPGVEPTPQQLALEAFGECMSFLDWEAANLGQLSQMDAEGRPCSDCHSAGRAGNYLSADSRDTFDNIKTYPYIQKYAITDANLNILPANRFVEKSLEVGGHREFTVPLDLQQGLQDFFDATAARQLVAQCPPVE